MEVASASRRRARVDLLLGIGGDQGPIDHHRVKALSFECFPVTGLRPLSSILTNDVAYCDSTGHHQGSHKVPPDAAGTHGLISTYQS